MAHFLFNCNLHHYTDVTTVAGGKYPQRSRKEEKGTPSPAGNVPKEVEKKKREHRRRREMSPKK